MQILGNTRPLTNTNHTYRVLDFTGTSIFKEWRVEYNGKIIGRNTTGVFKFHSNLAGKTVRVVAVVNRYGKEHQDSLELLILQAPPRILLVEWQDYNGQPVGKRKVAYLDKIKLCVKTANIPKGDTLDITVYEDDYPRDRQMQTAKTSAVDARGFAYLYFNNLSLYQTKLNQIDWIDESEHKYYVKIEYKNHISRTEDKIQLIIQNQLVKEIDKPKPTSNPVVVQKQDTSPKKEDKKKVNVTFNMFFDGTMNNMTNTEERIKKTNVYYDKSNQKDDSYTNYYSNVALLYLNNEVKVEENIISIYTEGIGTEDKKQDQAFPGGALGTGIAIYVRGIKDKVYRGLIQMKDRAQKKYLQNKIDIGKVTINVFGFSRGAAAARYFMSQENFIQMFLKLDSKKDINFNFIGLFDTVASYGIIHINDVSDLRLDIGGKAKKVIQLAAADEYRSNFKLTDVTSSIKAGVGYQLTMPGAHSDIGGGYSETTDEKRYLGEYMEYGDSNEGATKSFKKIKEKYIRQGWYTDKEFVIEKEQKTNFSKLDTLTFSTLYKLYGVRKGLKNSYQYIPLAIMKTFSETYGNMQFNSVKIKKYNVENELVAVKNQLYNYAIGNDGINALSVTLQHSQLMWVRNKYLHRSNKDDEPFTMGGRYDEYGNPDRDILKG